MEVRDLEQKTFVGMNDWGEAEEILLADLKAQVEASGVVFYRLLPNMFRFAAIVTNKEGTKWIHVTMDDVRTNPHYLDEVHLRRMSSERDWKGDAIHYCLWERLGEALAELMGDQYDDEVL